MKDTLLGKNPEVNAFAKKQGRQTGQKIKKFGQTCKRTFQEEKKNMKNLLKAMNTEWDRIVRYNSINYIKDIELRKQKADCVAYIGLIFQLQISLLQYEHDLLTCIEHKVFERTTCREKICFNDTKESFQVEGNKIITFLKKLDINLKDCQAYFYDILTKNELLENRNEVKKYKILKEYVGSVRRQLMIQVLYRKFDWSANRKKEIIRNIQGKQAFDYNVAMYKKGFLSLKEGISSCKDLIYDAFILSLRKTINWVRPGLGGFTGDRDRDKSTRENFGRLGSQVLDSLEKTSNSFQKTLHEDLKKQIEENFKEFNEKLIAQQTKRHRAPGQNSHIVLDIPAIEYKKSKRMQKQEKSSSRMQQEAAEKQLNERERLAQQARLQTQAMLKKLREQKQKKMEQQKKKGSKRARQQMEKQPQQQQQKGYEMQQQ